MRSAASRAHRGFMNDLLDLRLRLHNARQRRDALLVRSDAWYLASAEVDAAILLVWRHRPVSAELIVAR